MKNKKITGAMIAMAAAGMVALSPVVLADSTTTQGTAMVNCYGTNSCKGTGACKTASNSCKGMNACKGQGFVQVKTADECTKAGGALTETKKD